ncbi:MAG: nitroreductase family protein [Desulfobacteraceae bacterium]|nr:nitroreductase family protein [Desulfobacteraceae bacterium]
MIADLIKTNRTCRQFDQSHTIAMETLLKLINLGRLSASAANLQPLKYILSCSPSTNKGIFSCLAWAGYLKQWKGPEEGSRPSAYIVVLHDTSISKTPDCDHGIAAQSILLGAREQGLAGCMIGAIKKQKLQDLLSIPEHLTILLVLAIGKPREQVIIEQIDKTGDIRYWRDDNGVHHVPKRSMEDIVISRFEP